MSVAHTPGPWGIEQTRDMLWVGPMRPDGRKVDHVVVGLNIDSELTHSAALRQLYNSRLIAAAPELLVALEGDIDWLDALSQMTIERDTAMARIRAHRALIAKARGEIA